MNQNHQSIKSKSHKPRSEFYSFFVNLMKGEPLQWFALTATYEDGSEKTVRFDNPAYIQQYFRESHNHMQDHRAA